MDIAYPSAFERRVLAEEAPGGEPRSVSIVVPSVGRPGEPLAVKVAVLDEWGHPSLGFGGEVRLECPSARPGAIEIAFEPGRPAVAAAQGPAIDGQGLFRLSCRFAGKVFHSNPICLTERPERFIYWGDPHVHTVLSDCFPERCRSLNFCYVAGRWLAALDWVSAADHVSNGRGSPGKWREQSVTSDLYDDPGRFATLPAYEASLKGGCGGDNNIHMLRWPDIFVDEYEQGTVRTICEKMAGKLGRGEFFAVPHHTTRTGKHGEISEDVYPGPELMPVVEIHSKWGTSEYRGNPNPLHEVHPGPSCVVDLLNAGLRLGFIGGTDTHTTFPGWHDRKEPGHIDRLPGLTAVSAAQLSREAIFHGIAGRNCYATSLERIYLDVAVAGAGMGQAVPWPDASAPRRIAVTAAAASDIAAVEIVRNGRSIHAHAGRDWKVSFAFDDSDNLAGLELNSKHLGRFVYYYLRVTCSSGAQAWSSPVWLLMNG